MKKKNCEGFLNPRLVTLDPRLVTLDPRLVTLDPRPSTKRQTPAAAAFRFLQSLLVDFGVDKSKSKACPPTMRVTCLGVEFDTLTMTKSVHADRLAEIQGLLRSWSHKAKATKRDNLCSGNYLLCQNV